MRMASTDPPIARGRRAAAIALITLASLVAFLAIFAIWLNRQVLDTANWTRTSSELLERPVIRDQVAARLTDELYRSVDVEATLRDVLPARAEPLAGPAANALRDQVEKRARRALARPEVQALWADANGTAHEQLLLVLEGGGTIVSTEEGRVVLDVRELLARLQEQVGVGGRLRRVLPEGATRIAILESQQLGLAQDVVRVLKPLPVVLILLSLALGGAAMLVAPGWRRRALRAYGVGFVAAGAAALLARSVVGDMAVDSLASTAAAEPAVAEVWEIGTSLLVDIATAAIVYGLVMVAGAWLAGATGWAVAARRQLAPYLREPAIAYGTLAVALAVLVWWAPTPAWRNVVLLTILAALLAAGVEALRRQVIREHPTATRAAASERRRERFAAMTAGARRRGAALRTSVGGRAAAASERLATTSREAFARHGASPEDERLALLERLAHLQQAGLLDAQEVRAEKERILHGNGRADDADRLAPT
jgi:hypothetical protein